MLVLQDRPHKLLCSTGMDHKERLTEQGVLLTHTDTQTREWCYSVTVGKLDRQHLLLPVD